MLKGILTALIWIGVLGALALGMSLLVVRPLVADVCPFCFGLSKAADGVYVQSDMSDKMRERVAQTLTAAELKVSRFYGGMEHMPRVLVCADDACYRRIGGGGSRVGSLGDFVLMISPQGVDPVLMSHELSHVELHGRVGLWHISMGAVPMWFDEGVAVVVSDDPIYLKPANYGNRCVAGSFPDMPATPSEWQEEQEQEGDVLYAQSACKTVMWIQENGGPKAVTGLLAKLAQGQEFKDVYR